MPEGRQAAVDLGIAGHLHTRNPPDGGKAWSLTRRGTREPGGSCTSPAIPPQSPVPRLRTVFSGMDDPAVRHALDSLEEAPEFLFDSVHQMKMPRWSTGRVVLLGDAAWCPNLYSGMGATSALLGGAGLGRALREYPDDLEAALAAWESRLRPFIRKHQRIARLKQQMFVPSSRPVEAVRAAVLRLLCAARERRSATARASSRSLSAAPLSQHC